MSAAKPPRTMSSYFSTMKMNTRLSAEVDDMYNVHCHAGNLSRPAISESLRGTISSRSACQRDQPVNIADFGTADGCASRSLINEMIAVIKSELGREHTIVVYYNDQPMNDFNRLSQVIQGERQDSGLTVTSNVYPVIVPRSMYEQCLPSNSLDLAISSVATHYLSKQVCQIKNGICLGDADEHEQRLMREQAKADWRAFVISRGRELKPGGFLITMNESSDDNDEEPSVVDKKFAVVGSFVSDMAREGVITQEEYLATNLNCHYLRKAADFQEPFSSGLSEVRELGLELVSVKSIKHFIQHPTFDIVNKDETEKQEYSRRIVAGTYPWMYHALHGGLSISRTEDEKQIIIDQYFTRLQKYAFAHPDHKPYTILTEVVMKKRYI